jgi:hypothetical protein
MNTKEYKKLKKLSLLLPILIFTLLLLQVSAFCQTIESAREKYENKDYTGAEQELNAILESAPENIEAQTLLNEVQRIQKIVESQKLTERAISEINDRNFELAFNSLEEAILLDPENAQARELYLSIHEITEIEEESIEDLIEKEELVALKEEEERMAEEEAAQPEELVKPEEMVQPEEMVLPDEEQVAVHVEEKEASEGRYNRAIVKVSPTYTFANSNKLNYVNSSVSMIGGKFDGRYYFGFLQRRLGVSFDYSGYLIKTQGIEDIHFLVHRMNVSARFRYFFLEETYGRLTVGARAGYHFFTLQNLKSAGAYNFTRIYGPSFGIFLSDPVIYRFLKKDFFKDVGIEMEFNYLYIVGQAGAPSAPELYIGAYYILNRYRFSLGYRFYSIRQENVNENYNDIELGAGYTF